MVREHDLRSDFRLNEFLVSQLTVVPDNTIRSPGRFVSELTVGWFAFRSDLLQIAAVGCR